MIDAAIARVLLEASLRVCFVAFAVAAVLKLARVESSAVRHAAWASVVIAMLLMPLLPYVLPSFELPGRSSVAVTVAALPDDLPYVGDVVLTDTVAEGAPSVPGTAAATTVAPSASMFAGMPLWLVAAIAIYAIGLGMLLIRWLMAARFIAKLRRRSMPIATSVPVNVYECALAATPITVGAIQPWIVLPTEWKTWSAAKLAGVLAHERAHVDRHDPLFALVAYVNRCIFWFHPLAWWLERKLAATAEDAADDAGAKAMGQEREYAEVLVEMAEIVRRHGGRVAWQGVGVDGNGLLSKRIDRLLSGDVFREVSRMKKVLIALVCVAAVFIAVACRPHVAPAPLKPDPKVTAELETNRAVAARFEAVRTMTKEEAEALEAKVAQNPEDLESRSTLLAFYRGKGSSLVGTERAVAARRAHALWLIEHHPEAVETASALLAPTLGLADSVGYAAGRKLWLAHLEKGNLPSAAYSNAVSFLQIADLQGAEKIVLKARALEPNEVRWTYRLGTVYAMALTGTHGSLFGASTLMLPDPKEADNAFAKSVRAQLDASKDATLLASCGGEVVRIANVGPARESALREPFMKMGRGLIERAVTLEPASPYIVYAALRQRDMDIQAKVIPISRDKKVPAERFAAVTAMPDGERFPLLAWFADHAYMNGESADYYRHDTATAKGEFDLARQFASDLIALAPKYRASPDWSSDVFRAHVTLGLVALRNGDAREAVAEMKAAGTVPPSPAFSTGGQYNKLAETLLQNGERESVATFYDRIGELMASVAGIYGTGSAGTLGQGLYADAAKSIRAGFMPRFYQQHMAPQAAPNPFAK